MPMVTVMLEDGHPVHVPLRRTLAVPSGEISSSSQSPPSIWSAGRIPLRASWTRRISDVASTPAFQPETGQCGIYEDRPLDCRLYPIAVMWDRSRTDVVMGWDSKCPFIRDNRESAESRAYVERIAAFLESQEIVKVFIANLQLIGSFQDDVIVLRRLDRLTRSLHSACRPPAR